MKVKIFTNYDETPMCTEINNWISGNSINVVDMKYSNIADDQGRCFFTVLIMYTEN